MAESSFVQTIQKHVVDYENSVHHGIPNYYALIVYIERITGLKILKGLRGVDATTLKPTVIFKFDNGKDALVTLNFGSVFGTTGAGTNQG